MFAAVLFGVTTALSASAVDPQGLRGMRRVVIDPGHGGAENGAVGPGGVVEKELTLDVARRVAALLRAEGLEVTLTREGDDDVALDTRAGIANNRRADLFVSLHANAARQARAHGAETFFLSQDSTDDAARTTAALENDAAGISVVEAQQDGELPLILWDLAQTQYLRESSRLAETIQARLNEALGLKDRGVRQAPFRVLVGATCPAVLVELGFLSNPDEEKLLASPDHRRRLAEALTAAIRDFRASGGP